MLHHPPGHIGDSLCRWSHLRLQNLLPASRAEPWPERSWRCFCLRQCKRCELLLVVRSEQVEQVKLGVRRIRSYKEALATSISLQHSFDVRRGHVAHINNTEGALWSAGNETALERVSHEPNA